MLKQLEFRTFSSNHDLVKQRRDQIVRRATKVFIKRGYNTTNMRELCRACDMSPGTVYHYFGSKEDILYSMIHSATLEQVEHIESFARSLDTANATNALTQLVREFYKWHDENQDSTLFAYQETKNLPDGARQMIFGSENRILSVFEEFLKRGVELGEFSVSDPKLMAHNIVVMGHSWAFRRWHLRKYWTFETFVREQVDVILRTIRRGTIVECGEGNSLSEQGEANGQVRV